MCCVECGLTISRSHTVLQSTVIGFFSPRYISWVDGWRRTTLETAAPAAWAASVAYIVKLVCIVWKDWKWSVFWPSTWNKNSWIIPCHCISQTNGVLNRKNIHHVAHGDKTEKQSTGWTGWQRVKIHHLIHHLSQQPPDLIMVTLHFVFTYWLAVLCCQGGTRMLRFHWFACSQTKDLAAVFNAQTQGYERLVTEDICIVLPTIHLGIF